MTRSSGIGSWLTSVVVRIASAIVAVVVGVFLVVGGFAAGLHLGHPLAGFCLPLLGTVLALIVAQWLSSLSPERLVEFQLEPETPPQEILGPELPSLKMRDGADSIATAALGSNGPMWDRWLDGAGTSVD